MDNSTNLRRKIFSLVKAFPDEKLPDIRTILESLLGKDEDTRLTDEERIEEESNWQAYLKGEGIPWNMAREELADE